VRIIQIDGHDLFLDLILELVSALVLLTPLRVESLLRIVLSRTRLRKQGFSSSFVDDAALSLALEDLSGCLIVRLDRL